MEILTLPTHRAEDFLVVRSASRALAVAVGLEDADQVRLATALSEVAREVLGAPGHAQVSFTLRLGAQPAVVVGFDVPPGAPSTGWEDAPGLLAARRLVDDVQVEAHRSGGCRIHVVKHISATRPLPLPAVLLAAVRSAVPTTPLEELWGQNRLLAAALAEVRVKQEEALQLNAELEETNRGVMAMYSELTEELEETNRGVVALYAELDDKSVQLQVASQSKSRFFTAVSHELRSPVNAILGLARVLAEPDADPLSSEQRHQVGLIASGAGDLLGLVNQLLDLAKAEAGRIEPDVGQFDVAALAADLHGALRPLVDEDRVKLVVDVQPSLPPVHTDRDLLAQILRNLLVNAIRFTEDGEIRLRVRRTEAAQHLEYEVVDTGIGIDPAVHESVFEEFFQVRSPLQARTKGTGLGLSHCRHLVTLLGGEIVLTSEPALGSTFRVTLPIHWNAALTERAVEPAAPDVRHRLVLVADDDEGFRTALRGMLQGLTHQVTEAANGAEALRAMADHRPDVVFLDLRMPDFDGAEVLARMGENPALRDVPVVIVTSVDLGIDVTATLNRAHALIAKADVTPARIQDVLARLTPAP